MSKKVYIEVDRDTLEDVQMKIQCFKSQMITLIDLIADIPSDDKRKLDYQSKTLAIDLAAIARDFAQCTADVVNACIAEGGGIINLLQYTF